MNLSVILFGILPLLAFVLIDSFAGLKSGIIAGIVFAVAEVIYSVVVYQTIDELTIASMLLVIILGYVSFKFNTDIYFKLQPVVLGVLFSCVFFVMQLLDKPLLVMMFQKYHKMIPQEMQGLLGDEATLKLMAKLSGVLGWGFLIHAGLVAYSVFRMNTWWWLLMRGIGLYVMLFLCVVLVRFLII